MVAPETTRDSPQNEEWLEFCVRFAQVHATFRLPELKSLATLHGIEMQFDAATYSHENPFLIVQLRSAADAQRLVERSVLTQEIVELWAVGDTVDAARRAAAESPQGRGPPTPNVAFKFDVHCFGETLDLAAQRALITPFVEDLPCISDDMPVSLGAPDVVFSLFIDHGDSAGRTFADRGAPRAPKRVLMGRRVGQGARRLAHTYSLKTRRYLGTTSMDAELSLVMANMALARPGALVFDPFVGTGSFLVTCSAFGALTLGSDVDGRQIRGTPEKGSISSNVAQYGLGARVVDCLVTDITQHPWPRGRALFDAIVTDPPYGVRAGAKCTALDRETRPDAHHGVERVPRMATYEMAQVITDLVEFAAEFLVVGGRLVFWLPTSVYNYSVCDIPSHVCLRLLSTSLQLFGKWCRVLVTMEKCRAFEPGLAADHDARLAMFAAEPGHSHFRDLYFAPPPVSDAPSVLYRQMQEQRAGDEAELLLASPAAVLPPEMSRGKQKRMVRFGVKLRLREEARRQRDSV